MLAATRAATSRAVGTVVPRPTRSGAAAEYALRIARVTPGTLFRAARGLLGGLGARRGVPLSRAVRRACCDSRRYFIHALHPHQTRAHPHLTSRHARAIAHVQSYIHTRANACTLTAAAEGGSCAGRPATRPGLQRPAARVGRSS